MNKYIILFLISLIFSSSTVSCADHNLSRSTAEKMLQERLDSVGAALLNHTISPGNVSIGQIPFRSAIIELDSYQGNINLYGAKFDALIRDGYVEVNEIRTAFGTLKRCSLTEKSKPFYLWGRDNVEVKTCDLKILRVTGITVEGYGLPPEIQQQLGTMMRVTYEVGAINLTPFSSLESGACSTNKPWVLEALFKMYDDGWRIEGMGYSPDR